MVPFRSYVGFVLPYQQRGTEKSALPGFSLFALFSLSIRQDDKPSGIDPSFFRVGNLYAECEE